MERNLSGLEKSLELNSMDVLNLKILENNMQMMLQNPRNKRKKTENSSKK